MPQPSTASSFPSLNFLLLVLVFAVAAVVLWQGTATGQAAVLLFVVSGWVVSLCLHEFGHALVAFVGGDSSIPATGYLSLDPLRYADPFLSILLPLVFILVGGFGLPGGAVWVDHGALRNRLWDAAVSAAGPVANVLCLLGLGALYAALPHGERTTAVEAAVAVLAYFQGTAIVLNLLPIPGFDGFGILRPFLPGHVRAAGNRLAAGAGLVLILLVFAVPAFADYVFRAGLKVTALAGIDPHDVYVGSRALRLF